MILAIDTATRYAGIALYDGRAVLLEHTWLSNANHTVELMPNIMRALGQRGMGLRDLQGLVVASGPGSFTGLRIGLSVAKGMAYASGKPLLGVPTLDILGYAYTQVALPTCAIIQAGRRRFCVATYQRTPDGLERIDDYRIISQADLIAGIDRPTYFCGELGPDLRDQLQARLGEKARLAHPAASVRRPGYLAELGWQRLQRGERDNLATLSPMYLHDPGMGASA